MTKQVRRSNVAKGVLVPLGNGFSLAIGKHPEKVDDIDIGPNNKNGLSVNHGEIIQNTGDGVRVFSAEPMLGGQSPAQLLYGGANPNAVFAAQEHWKDVHKVNDDGSHYKKGGKRNTPVKETNMTSVQRDSAQVNIFKPGDNSRIQTNRAKHRTSLGNFVKNNPTLYGLNTSDFVDFLLDNATMESENSSTASHGSMYGYYQLKGLNKKSTEDQQHRAAFRHLANLFNNVLTDADIQRAKELGISQAQLLHKTWNQERKVLNYLYQGKDNSDGLGTKISDWGNNNSLEMDYSPYVMKATNDNNIVIKPGDTPEGILKAYRGPGLKERTFNDHAKDFQTIFGKSPNNLQINDVLTNAYLIGPRKSDGTFKYGGSLINQSLGERPNAKFGKEMGNKKKILKYPKLDITYEGGTIKADKLEGKQLPAGTRISQTVNGGIGVPNTTPGYNQAFRSYTRLIKYGETPEQNDTTYKAGRLTGVGLINPKDGFNVGYYDGPEEKAIKDKVQKELNARRQQNKEIQPTTFDMPITNHPPVYYNGDKKLKYGGERKKAVYGRDVDPFMGYGRKLPDMPFTLTRGANGYLTPQFKPIEVPKLDIGPKPAFKEVDPFMGIRKLGVDPVPTSGINTGNGGTNSGGGGISAKGMDWIGGGIQTLGNLAAAGIQQIAINNMKVTPHQYTLLNPVKLKTKVNIAPQVAAMRDTVAKLTDVARRTSASSRTMYQKTLDARRYGDQQISGLLGEKENKETALINQDRLNQQTIAEKNANRVMDTINGNTDRRVNLKNEKRRLTANNWIGAINNQVAILDGPQGIFAREEARRSQAANLAMMSLAYPDAARLMQGDRWTHAFDGYYDMLNSRGGH